MNPPCNLPKGEQEAVLGLFRGTLTPEEEQTIRAMFPQYLFFRNEYTDDGWNVSDGPVRMCTCTACGETFEAVRGNYPRGKLHNEECNCPSCGARVTGKAVDKFRYQMSSLESWIKVAVACPTEGGALMIEAGDVRRRFSHDELTGTVDWYPEKRYYFGSGVCQQWEHRVLSWACSPLETKELRWLPTATIRDPFPPNKMNCDYSGDYLVVGLREALEETELRYCQIMDFYHYECGADLDRDTARWIVKYLGWYAHHPQIEMAVKLGLGGAVYELAKDGLHNTRLLDWTASTPAEFLRMSKADVHCFRQAGMDFADLKTWKRLAGGMRFGRYVDLVGQARGTENLQRILFCGKKAGFSPEKAVRYVRGQEPECARYAPPLSRIIETWEDYLRMAEDLGYDLSEPTVAAPKDLQDRHDAAAAIIRHNADDIARKKYEKRRKKLEKLFGFALGGLRVVVPGSAQEIVDEGQTLHHCVGGYAGRHVSGSTTILFIRHERRPERSFLTVEMYEDRGRWKIRQIHGYRNEGYKSKNGRHGTDPAKKYAWFLEAWLGRVNNDKEAKTA